MDTVRSDSGSVMDRCSVSFATLAESTCHMGNGGFNRKIPVANSVEVPRPCAKSEPHRQYKQSTK